MLSARGAGTSWGAKLKADKLVLFTSRSSGPLGFWGETTKYQFNHVSAVTALCLHVDARFLGRKWVGSRYGINVHQSTQKNNVVDSLFLRLTWGERQEAKLCRKLRTWLTLLHEIHVLPSKGPQKHQKCNSPSQWRLWDTNYINAMEIRAAMFSPVHTQIQTDNLRTYLADWLLPWFFNDSYLRQFKKSTHFPFTYFFMRRVSSDMSLIPILV